MNLIKKQGLGTWISLGALLLSIVGLIIYGVALAGGTNLTIASGSEMFYLAERVEDTEMMSKVVLCGVLALVFLVAAIVLGQFKFDGIVGKVVGIVVGALRAVVAALIFTTLLYFAYGSLTGLGWTFFSNEELFIYPEAITVGNQVIAGLVIFGIAGLVAIVASFFSITKKNAD